MNLNVKQTWFLRNLSEYKHHTKLFIIINIIITTTTAAAAAASIINVYKN